MNAKNGPPTSADPAADAAWAAYLYLKENKLGVQKESLTAAPEVAGLAAGGMAAGEGLGMLGASEAGSLMVPEALTGSALLGALPTGLGVEPGWAAANAGAEGWGSLAGADWGGAQVGAGPAWVNNAAQASKGLSAFQKAQLYGKLGEMVSGSSQRPAGSPILDAPPQVRQQLQSQEEITKRWLQKNDPNTFARLYGSTGLMG